MIIGRIGWIYGGLIHSGGGDINVTLCLLISTYGLGSIATTIYGGKTSNAAIDHWDIWILVDSSRMFSICPDELRSRKGNRCREKKLWKKSKAHSRTPASAFTAYA